jgi:uncharacterized glyoxalase superfamily protein PhnB
VPARLYVYLSYPDAAAALRWFAAVGFETVRRQDGDDGSVQHAEVRLGDAVVMVASDDAPYTKPALVGRSTGQGIYLLVDDVDTTHARALAAGATEVLAPEGTEWGTRRASVLDPGGTEWSFGTYEPGATW